MRCLICTHKDSREINLALLSRTGRRAGLVVALAKKLGCTRQVLWNHRKNHLKLNTSREAPKAAATLEERATMLGQEADRLQMQIEHGAEKSVVEQALKALAMRVKLLEIEGQLGGRLRGGKPAVVTLDTVMTEAGKGAAPDPEEEARALREFQEVVGDEK